MGGGQPLPADRPMPRYRPTPEYPFLPDGRQLPVYRPMPAERPAECWPADDLAALAYPPVPDYPAVPRYLAVRDNAPVPDWPAAPVWRSRALLRRLARLGGRRPAAGRAAGRRAAIGYLTVPLLLVPLAIYLSTLRGPRWARGHAAQALDVWLTGIMYDLAAVIMAAMLALDSPRVALIVFAPLVSARWAVTLTYLARAARAAGRGAPYAFPSWLCIRIVR